MAAIARIVAGIALCAACGAVAVGCGGRQESRVEQLTGGGIVPADAFVVASLSIDTSDRGSWSRAQQVLRRVPAFALVEEQLPDAQQAVDQLLLLDPRADHDLDFARDVEPWLGKRGGFAMWRAGDERVGIAWLETDDEDAALDAMRKVYGEPDEHEVDGTTLYHGDGGAWWAIVEGRLVVGTGRAALERAVRGDRGSLARNEDVATVSKAVRSRGLLVQAVVTPALWEDVSAAPRLERYARYASAAAGVDDDGVWMDAALLGDAAVTASGGNAGTMLDGMPGTALAAIASSVSPAGLARWLGDTRLTASAGSAYAPGASFAAAGRAGQLAMGVRLGVQNPTMARATVDVLADVVNARLALKGTVSVDARAPSADQVLDVRGIRTARILERLTTGRIEEARLRQHPLVRQFARGVSFNVSTTQQEQRFVLAQGSVDPLDVDGAERLVENARYRRDMRRAKPARGAHTIAWFDVAALAKLIVGPLDRQASFVVQGQLEHLGGPVAWSSTRRSGDSTMRRMTVELPIYG